MATELPPCYRCNRQPCECTDGITLYHADCRTILPHLPPVDLVLTDPPYGIGERWTGGPGPGWDKSQAERPEKMKWDGSPPEQGILDAIIAHAKVSIVWGGNYFDLPPSRCWLVWNKPERGFSLAEAELAWTNAENVARVFDHRRHVNGRQHPTQKPLALFCWCLKLPWAKGDGTILDPYAGSGTAGVAAKLAGRKAILCEIEQKYCDIIVERLRQEVLF